MAQGDKERKMLFDVRGRRRNVIKVVYAVLALLMGLSLILLAGPGIGGLGGGGGGNAAEASEERAERIEARLAKEPENPDLLASLTRTQVAIANALSETNPATGEANLTVAARQELERASSTWSEYLEAADQPAPGVAQLMSPALFSLAETSRTSPEALRNIAAAAAAQGILAEQRPSLGTLSTYAFYTAYSGEFKEAEAVLAEAKKYANTKFERQQLQNQFNEIEERARSFAKQVREAEERSTEGAPAGGGEGGGEGLENPFSLGGGATGGG